MNAKKIIRKILGYLSYPFMAAIYGKLFLYFHEIGEMEFTIFVLTSCGLILTYLNYYIIKDIVNLKKYTLDKIQNSDNQFRFFIYAVFTMVVSIANTMLGTKVIGVVENDSIFTLNNLFIKIPAVIFLVNAPLWGLLIFSRVIALFFKFKSEKSIITFVVMVVIAAIVVYLSK